MSRISSRVVLASLLGALALPALAVDNALFVRHRADRESVTQALAADSSYWSLVGNPASAAIELVRAEPSVVDERSAQIALEIEPGFTLRAHRTESYRTASGATVWAGVIENLDVPLALDPAAFDPHNTAVLVRRGAQVTGNVRWDGQLYQIRPLRSGGHAIVLADASRIPADHPPSAKNLPIRRMATAPVSNAPTVDTVITIMVHYTPASASAVGDILGLIDLAVAESNQGYANSGVAIDLSLVHASQVSYTESGSFDTDLARYRGTSDGFMDAIHTTRDSVAADVGLLLINNTQYCGLASGIGSTAATAFATAYWDCATGYYSFAHEVGHLQSARHDPRNDPSTTPYAYGHGYQWTKNPKWRTIMAYNCSGSGCPRLNYWSNPNNLYNGQPMGTASKNDNARVLNQTAATIAGFR